MKKVAILRITVNIAFFIFIIHGWWIAALLLAFIGSWFFQYYFEIILFGIIFDSLFGFVNSMGIYGYLGSIVSLIIFMVVLFLKRALR
jgi:hypothetical protein